MAVRMNGSKVAGAAPESGEGEDGGQRRGQRRGVLGACFRLCSSHVPVKVERREGARRMPGPHQADTKAIPTRHDRLAGASAAGRAADAAGAE